MRRLAPRMLLLLLALLACAGPTLGLARPAVAGPAPKITFDIAVSTEWQPGDADSLPDDRAAAGCPAEAKDSYLADLEAGLRAMAGYFYRYTGGQMAIGKVTLYTGGQAWDSANIRILANQSYRPTAFVGGITNAPTAYYSATGSLTPAALFYPAPILLSRQWDGRGARCGPWSAPEGWRTIGHEWGHYALYLYDEYMNQSSAAEQYCDRASAGFWLLARGGRAPSDTGSAVASLMAYHYTADQLSLWLASAAPPQCQGTPQTTVYGASDWATVARFYESRGVTAPGVLTAGPADAPPIDVTIVPQATPRANTAASATLDALPSSRLVGQAYLIRPIVGADGAPLRILSQGNILPGESQPMRFWGVQTDQKDRAAVQVQDFTSGARYSFPSDYRPSAGPPPLSTSTPNAFAATASKWSPSLEITPIVTQNPFNGFSDVTGLRVRLTDCGDKPPARVEMSYCPAGGDCGGPVTADPSPSGSFDVTFSFSSKSPAAVYGYIYAREPLRGAETMTWYQLDGGVGPAHGGGHAPAVDGQVAVDMAQNDSRAPNSDNRVLYSPVQVCGAQLLPPGVDGIVGPPFSIQTVIADPNGGHAWNVDLPPLRVRLGYDQDLLDRLGIDESRLFVLRLNGQRVWQPLPSAGRSFALDWVAARPQSFSGNGEIYALGYGPARVLVPLVSRGK